MKYFFTEIISGTVSTRDTSYLDDKVNGLSNLLLGGLFHYYYHSVEKKPELLTLVFSNIRLFYKSESFEPIFSTNTLFHLALAKGKSSINALMDVILEIQEKGYGKKLKKMIFTSRDLAEILQTPERLLSKIVENRKENSEVLNELLYDTVVPHNGRGESQFFYTVESHFSQIDNYTYGFYWGYEGNNDNEMINLMEELLSEFGLGGYKSIGKGFFEIKVHPVPDSVVKRLRGPGVLLGDVYDKEVLSYIGNVAYYNSIGGPDNSYRIPVIKAGSYYNGTASVVGRDREIEKKTFPAKTFPFKVIM